MGVQYTYVDCHSQAAKLFIQIQQPNCEISKNICYNIEDELWLTHQTEQVLVIFSQR